jgi:acyl carrier protein
LPTRKWDKIAMANDYQTLVVDIVSPFLESGVDLSGRTPLAEQLDSLEMVQVILALEGRLGCRFGPTDIQFDHFETIDTLARQLASIRLPNAARA